MAGANFAYGMLWLSPPTLSALTSKSIELGHFTCASLPDPQQQTSVLSLGQLNQRLCWVAARTE